MATSPAPERLRVLVASDQALIADAVRAALSSRGHDALVVRWPGDTRAPGLRRQVRRTAMMEVGLLLSDLDRWSRIRAAMVVVERIGVPWVALTTAPRGPAWGGILTAGAKVVLPGTTRLEHISDLLLSVVQRQVTTPADERLELEAAWQEMRARHDDVAERLSRLTPREREVLRLMYAGSSVASIAEMFEVAPATVRSQVKSVLRKLDVNSQLAAVAAFDDVLDILDRRPGVRAPMPRAPMPPSSSTPSSTSSASSAASSAPSSEDDTASSPSDG
jgi:two-component system nitrate/nitrite response regulator NarL